ncbi:Hypothetical protein R9X50_00036100 [Acrodontium crateriforme]|uniref:Uncharacterized protein n=1 Tax=Acrodontium crateriforme TaxID=150365 RepID=A0AAQ3R4V4_9PEZI|nr:Hypothetical protein R9X50_00036100 [Acrodontium crateriforme]
MGNKPSSLTGSPTPDDQSARSVVRKPVNPARFLRKSSANLILRIDSRSPLTEPTTPKVTVSRGPASSSDFGETDYGDGHKSDFNQPPNHARTPPIIVPPRKHSTSTVIVTDDEETQPLSASTTIKGRKSCSRNESRAAQVECHDDMENQNSLTALRSSALSPTIPAPSPVPEDSPHKYGLLDRMDTPEVQPAAEDVSAIKARRPNNGVEIFKEAKTLQSAASFLNGLSTSRRRAESASRSTESYAYVSRPNSRRGQVGADRESAIRQTNSTLQLSSGDFEGRRKGHNFKANGFAYSRPLAITQLKCYSTHARLVISKNKVAPVECAVCHMDDDHEHYSCSWCAIRMCRYCRKEFAERGISALRDRIKQAEMSADDSSSSVSMRSLTRGRSTLF